VVGNVDAVAVFKFEFAQLRLNAPTGRANGIGEVNDSKGFSLIWQRKITVR
jgi:hypothetical protein